MTHRADQKKCVWGGALSAVGFLRDPDITRWITPGGGRREFHPAGLIAAGAALTVYMLSRDGSAAAPVVTALSWPSWRLPSRKRNDPVAGCGRR